MTTKEHFEKNILPYFNIKEYFDKGYKGQGITIATMESTTDSHGNMVVDTLLTYAPNCKVISYTDIFDISTMSDNGENVEFPKFADWCIENKADIITSSLDWSCNREEERQAIQKLYDNGIIFCNCAGNSGGLIKHSNKNKTYGFDKECLTISGIMLDTKGKISWSGFNYGEGVDLCSIGTGTPTIARQTGTWYGWGGTSSATPMVAGMLATYKSFDKTLNAKNVFEKIVDKMTTYCEYEDYKHKILILPKMEDVNMENKDWKLEFEEVWERATKLKVVDGTRPNEPITRNELVVILDRLGLLK